ncbi:MAG: hypothetical protein JW918_14135 [Anaerolineae bacterium]|nr:hypothetical protein [Anaerolineae bacterium]
MCCQLDYRENLIVDANNPVLAFKATRDRYTGEGNPFAGRPYLASPCSEDALTWNVFRWLQAHGHEDVIGHCLGMEIPKAILFWGFDCQSPGEYQFALGELIRSVDGVRRGQVTEPDLVLIGPKTVLFVECKLGRAGQPLYQPWSGKGAKRLGDYREQLDRARIELFGPALEQTKAECYYQLVRNTFYAVMLARALERQNAVVTALLNADNTDCNRRYATPREQLAAFRELVRSDACQVRLPTWQDVTERIEQQIGVCQASVRLRQTLEGCR